MAFAVISNRFASKEPYEAAIAEAFGHKTTSTTSTRTEIECLGFRCEDVLPLLPPVTTINCFNHDMLMACCSVGFEGGCVPELHVKWRGVGRYKISLPPPRCVDPADPERDLRCDELWASRGQPAKR